jgi:hypothetical protein
LNYDGIYHGALLGCFAAEYCFRCRNNEQGRQWFLWRNGSQRRSDLSSIGSGGTRRRSHRGTPLDLGHWGYVDAVIPLFEKIGIAKDLDEGSVSLGSARDATSFVAGLGKLRVWAREPKVKMR